MYIRRLIFYLSEKLRSVLVPVKNNTKCTFTCCILMKIVRLMYIIFDTYYVTQSMYSTFRKYKEGRTVVSITENDYHQYMYPSITFCTKFKNGRSALAPYFDILFEDAKTSGKIK